MEDYVWYIREVEMGSNELKELLLDGWEPISNTGMAVSVRKLVTRGDFELLWLQDQEELPENLPEPIDPRDDFDKYIDDRVQVWTQQSSKWNDIPF